MKKNQSNWLLLRCGLLKMFKPMRLTIFVLFISLTQVFAASSYSLDTRLTMKLRNVSIEKVLDEVEKHSEFYFLYNKQMVDVERKVSIDVKDEIINDVLNELFNGTNVTFNIVDRQILLVNSKVMNSKELSTQQTTKVAGKVVDNNGEPLPGVTILIKGTSKGTITNYNGEFLMPEVNSEMVLQFSFIGMESQEIVVGDQTYLSVVMVSDAIGLEEVVAIGYGTMKKNDLTGAVVNVDVEDIGDPPSVSVIESLQGQVPGLEVGQTLSAGSSPDMLIRGKSTLAGSQSPLIVVDGVIYRGSMSDINPSNINSVNILKDASAAAVYGAQATNGVILITTIKGKGVNGKPRLSYSGKYTFYEPVKELVPPDVNGFWQQTADSDIFQSRTEESGYLEMDPDWDIVSRFSDSAEGDNYADGRYTDWYDVLTNDNMYSQEHNLSVSNSAEGTSYLAAFGYTTQEGYMVNDQYERFNARINLDTEINKWLKIGVQSFATISDFSGAEGSRSNRYIEPYAAAYDENGDLYNTVCSGIINPYHQFERENLNQRLNLFANVYASINVPFVKGLNYKVNFAQNYRRGKFYEFREYAASWQGEGEKEVAFSYDWTSDHILNYNRTFATKHNVQATFLYGAEKRMYESTGATGQGYINKTLGYNRLHVADAELQKIKSSAWEESALYSMGRVFYSFDNKYMVTGTVRRDGYSGFSKNNKFGVFPSVSFAWNISQENFLSSQSHWLDQLKLRASYGTVGNRTIGRYQTLARVGGGYGYIDINGKSLYTHAISSLESADLKWEKTTGLNLGVNFAIFSQRIIGSVDYYNNNTKDLFYKVDIPAINRYTTFPSNLGRLHNQGLELSITSYNIQKDNFSWSTTVNFSRNRNQLKELLGFDLDGDGVEDDLISEGLFIGESIDAIYDYEIDGKWQLGDDIPDGYDVGAHKPVDQNGDGVIKPEDDKVIVGYKTPSFTMGIGNQLRYKNWSLKFFIHTVQGGDKYYRGADNFKSFQIQNTEMHFRNIFPADVDFWTPENPNARYQRPNIQTASGLQGNLYGDRSFIRLQNVTLSYNIPKKVLNPIGLNSGRIYFNGKNLLTFTDWNGWDPESNQTITRDGRPVLKGYTFGVAIDF